MIRASPPAMIEIRPTELPSCASRELFRRGAFALAVHRGPCAFTLKAPAGGLAVALATGAVEDGTPLAVVVGPGVELPVALAAGQARLVVEAAVGSRGEEEAPTDDGWGRAVWLVFQRDVVAALEPRGKVKVVEAELWRPSSPRGTWAPGTEIPSDALALSFFRGGCPERPHVHGRAWELYAVVRGALAIDVQDAPGQPWTARAVGCGEALALPPEAPHLVHEDCDHLSAVVQVPPALGDRRDAAHPGRSRGSSPLK